VRHLATIVLVTALLVLLSSVGLPSHISPPVARAAQTWTVQVGGDPAPGITMINYYPRASTINVGDTINFVFPAQEPHTVTFDAGAVPGLFLTGITPNSPNQGDIDITKAFSPLNSDGTSATYDGSQAVSSGNPTDPPDQRMPFAVTFPKAGEYYFECAVHGPEMSGFVTVLVAGSALPATPDQAKAHGAAEMAQDVTNNTVAAKAFPIQVAKATGPSGSTLYTIDDGAPGFHASVVQMLPQNLTVKRGDYVTWTQPDVVQFHTVTFLSGAAPPQFIQIIPQPGGPPRIVIPAATNAPSGGNTYTGSGTVNSGTLTVGNSFTLKVDAPPGTYEYVCLFHADDYNMKGTITVTP
jgi:plastocyanin